MQPLKLGMLLALGGSRPENAPLGKKSKPPGRCAFVSLSQPPDASREIAFGYDECASGGLLGGINTYFYVDGSPTAFADPWGLQRATKGGTGGSSHQRRQDKRHLPEMPGIAEGKDWKDYLKDLEDVAGQSSDPFADFVCFEAICTYWDPCTGKKTTRVVTQWMPPSPLVPELPKNCICKKMDVRKDYDPTGAPPNPWRPQF